MGTDALITADPSIASAARGQGLDVLRIAPGHIRLDGYPYGFIGGCCGLVSERSLYVFGSFAAHPDGARIQAFLDKHGVTAVFAAAQPLSDYGSLLRVT